MTKREAQAILRFRNTVNAALGECLSRLSEPERRYAEAYWAERIRQIVNVQGHGALPVMAAELLLGRTPS